MPQLVQSTRGVLWVSLALVWLLSGCQITPGPAWQTFRAAARWPWQPASAPVLDPRFEYFLLTQTSSSDYLALGYRVVRQAAGEGVAPMVIEHWYSARRELYVLEDGRLNQAVGTPLEWRAVRAQGTPRWHELADGDLTPKSWVRRRDEMPGYRYDVVDQVLTRLVDPRHEAVPTLPPALAATDPAKLVWVSDDIRSSRADGSPWQHTQWFALVRRLNGWSVVWSRQCLGPDRCLDMQPLAVPAS